LFIIFFAEDGPLIYGRNIQIGFVGSLSWERRPHYSVFCGCIVLYSKVILEETARESIRFREA